MVVHLGFAIPLTNTPTTTHNNNNHPHQIIAECEPLGAAAVPPTQPQPTQQQQYPSGALLGHRSFRWSTWDGGKIGGRPSWLNPRDLPRKTLRCRSGHCRGDNTATATTQNSTAANTIEGGGTILQFIAQLYCPADDDTENEAAFHRSLYVFACPTCCSDIAREEYHPPAEREEENAATAGGSGASTLAQPPQPLQHHCRLSSCIRVLRCQLPLTNDFYPPTSGTSSSSSSSSWPVDDDRDDDDVEQPPWLLHTSEYWAQRTNDASLHLCAVCGQRSEGKCPKQRLWFCGGEHQRECLRASKERRRMRISTSNNDVRSKALMNKDTDDDDNDTTDLNVHLPSVCREYELIVEEEPTPPPPTNSPSADATTSGIHAISDDGNISALFLHNSIANEDDDDDDDANLEQSDLNALVAEGGAARGGGIDGASSSMMGVTDPVTLAFYDRLAIGGTENDVKDQCLRYCRWPERKKMEGEDEDEEDVGIGPLWLSSRNRPPSTMRTMTTTTTTTTSATKTIPSDAVPITAAADSSTSSNYSFPPPCQYCGSPRSFEFQIMPQMLFYLLQSSTEKKNDDKLFGTRKLLSELDKAILFEGQSKIDNGMDLPLGFMEAHGDAMKSAREALLGAMETEKQAENNTGSSNKGGSLDWGTIAVYTCTASCGNGGIGSKENGAYMEEVAWMQPPL